MKKNLNDWGYKLIPLKQKLIWFAEEINPSPPAQSRQSLRPANRLSLLGLPWLNLRHPYRSLPTSGWRLENSPQLAQFCICRKFFRRGNRYWVDRYGKTRPPPPYFCSQFVATFFTVLYHLVTLNEKLQTTWLLSIKAKTPLNYWSKHSFAT